MSTVHLEHALLDVRDMNRSLLFYRALFPDWVVRWEGSTQEGTRWIHFGPSGGGQPGYLSLYETPGAGQAAGDGARIEHIGFAHPDIEGLATRLAAAGIRPSDRAGDASYRRIYFVDPDGHELEFVEALPAG